MTTDPKLRMARAQIPAKVTHYVRVDQPGRRLARAICFKLVDRYHDHATAPSCETCRQRLAEHEAMEL